MFVTPSLDVLLSSTGEIDLHLIDDCMLSACTASYNMIVESISYLRNNQKSIDKQINESTDGYIEVNVAGQYWTNIFPYSALYMKQLLFDREPEKGYILITYDEIHWDDIDAAYAISWIISGLMLLVGTVLVCCNIKFHRKQFFERQLSQSLQDTTRDVVGTNGHPMTDFNDVTYDDTNDNNPNYTKALSAFEEHKEEKEEENDDINHMDDIGVKDDEQQQLKSLEAPKTEMVHLDFQTTNLSENEEKVENEQHKDEDEFDDPEDPEEEEAMSITPTGDANNLQSDEDGALNLI